MAAVVELRDVSYRVGDVAALRHVDLCVEEGETLVLLGRSGSGKTTLLKTVNRLITPTTGDVRFQGRSVLEWDPIQLRRRIGYVIQDGGLFPHVTVEANVGLVPKLEGWPEARIRTRTAELLDALGLPVSVYGSRYPGSFRVARSSGSALRERWLPILRCCCWTNRSPLSTRSRVLKHSGSSSNSGSRFGRLRCL